MTKGTQIEDRGTALLAGDVAPLSRSAWADTAQIIPFPRRNAASGWGEASVPEDLPPSIGTLAVKIVTRLGYPRVHCEMMAPDRPGGEEDRSDA